MTKRMLLRFLSVALSVALLIATLSVGLTSFATAPDRRQSRVERTSREDDWAAYRAHAEYFSHNKRLSWRSSAWLQSELQTARVNYEALRQISRSNPSAYEGLSEEYALNLSAAQEYMTVIAQALTVNDAHDLVAIIAKAIQGEAPYPAMTYNPTYQTYTFNAAGLSFEQILALYERVVLADAALTGSIAGEPNFPGYNVAARLASAHGITGANAPARAIAAVRASVQGVNPRLLADYSDVPAGSGWTGDLNFDPAPAEWAALVAAGGPLLADEGKPSYERMPSAAHPAPITVLVDDGANPPYYVTVNTPSFAAYPRGSAAPNPAVDPAAHAAWQFTQAVYGWIDRYEQIDYPAAPNTAAPPADNSTRENSAFPIAGTDAQKYDYILKLQQRYQLNMTYLMALDNALRQPENIYRWLQTAWSNYQSVPGEANRQEFNNAVSRYYSLLAIQPDGTYVNSNGAFVPNGVNEEIAAYSNMLRQMDIVTIYGAFFNSYRLSLEPEDFARYSNDNLSGEYAATQQRLRQFLRDYPGDTMLPAWDGYLKTVQQAIFLRVFDEIDSLSGEAAAIAREYDPHTLLSGEYAYNLNNLDLWPLIKGLFTLTEAQQAQLALAQQVLALLRGHGMNYETLHWDLIEGKQAPMYDDWLPTRGLQDPMVLKVGHDEFHVEYEHVENMINKLDTLLTSEWFNEKFGEAEFPHGLLNLLSFDSEFLSRLGQMRTSSGELVITDPRTSISITLPPLETARNTDRYVDEAAGTTAERRWIQAYRGDVLLYLLHTAFEAVNTGETDGLPILSWILHQIIPQQQESAAEAAKHLTETVPQALQNAMEGMDLSAAVRPFMTNLLTEAVSEKIVGDALPNTILGFYRMVAEAMSPILDGPLLRRPGDTSGRGLIDDVRFAVVSPRIDLTLGYMLEQISGRYRYAITVNDLLNLPEFNDMFDFGASSWLELMLGAQITPQEMTANWPDIWPKVDGVVPAGAPAYVQAIAENLSAIYDELDNSNAQFPSANFQFGLEKIDDYAQQRQAFEDVAAFAMSGLAFFFSAVFSESPLEMSQMQGKQDDYWYNDLIVGLEGVTRGLNNLIEGALRIFNAPLELLGLPTINFTPIKLPDLRVSDYVGDSDYLENQGDVHWRGRFDSRVGVESTLTAANAYGKIFIPLFELLGIPRELILYSETEFNQRIAALAAAQDDAARDEIALTLTRSLFNPLLNWLAPVDDAQVPLSLGFRPLGKLLDILPNLAFVTEQNIIPKLVSDVLDDLRLDVTLHLGGAGGDSMGGLIEILADYMQYELFDMNFFLDLFVFALPDLIGAGPLLTSILEAAGMGMAFIFSVPMVEIVSLPSGSYTGMFSNRNDGGGTAAANEDFHVTILKDATSIEPGPGVRPATLATIAGYFGGDSAARSLSFKLFGETGLPLGQMMNDRQPVLRYLEDQTGIDFSGDMNTSLDDILPAGDGPEYEQNEEILQLLEGVAQNSGHAIAWLVELFNPQTYPTRDFMNYALLDQAKSRNRVLNEVQYSKIWTRKEAETYIARLPEFLDNFSAFCYEQTFLDWLYDRLEEAWGLDMRNLYTTENLKRLIEAINEHAGGLLPWLGLPELALDESVAVTDRDSFVEALIEVLLPAAPMLKTLLIGGRESETPWFGDQYANNGVKLDLSNTASPGIGRAGDNLTIWNDYIGVSGYDGYKHGVIPMLEAFGVPQRDILTHEEYVAGATGANGDAQLFRLIIEPLLGVVDRIVADPIGELPQVLGNIAYFLAAEGGNENMAEDGSAKNGFVEALNRIFRPVYAALDMVTPMADLGDMFGLLGLDYPFQLSIGGMHQDVWLPPDVSLNSIITGLSRRWFAELSDDLGLELTLALEDILETLTGTLTVYRSVNGQNDAVRLKIDRADLLTQVARRLLPLIFSEDNWAEMRLYIAARLSPVTRDAVLYLLDAVADMVRGMEGDKAADLVLAVMFHLFLGKNHMIEKLFALRECRDRLIAFFEKLSINDALGPIAILAGTTLVAGTAVAVVPLTLAGAAALVLGGLGLTGLAARLAKEQPCCKEAKRVGTDIDSHSPDCPNARGSFVKPPKTGDSYAIVVGASIIGGLALLGAALTLKKRRKYA